MEGNALEAADRGQENELNQATDHRLFSVRVFPNPVVDQTWVDCPDCIGQPTTLQLFDLRGALIWQQQEAEPSGRMSIDFTELALPPGAYLLTVQTGENTTTQKIVLQPNP